MLFFKKLFKSFVSLLAAALITTQFAQAGLTEEHKSQLVNEMKVIAGIYNNQYAPKQWKEKHLGWNIEAEINSALNKINSATSVYEYRNALLGFVKSTQDYHVSMGFYSTEKASLPFSVRTIEGKTLLVQINRDKLSKEAFPFSVGDQLLAIDEKTLPVLLGELVAKIGHNVPTTDLALADIYVTRRSGGANMQVPRGPVTLTLQRVKDKTAVTHQLVWEYQIEEIPGTKGSESFFNSMLNFNLSSEITKKIMPLVLPLVLPLPEMKSELALQFTNSGTSWGIGEKTSFIPELGEKIWQSADDSIFDAYIYLNSAGKLVGVIRIPSYTPEDEDLAIKEMAALIEKMEKQTSALVIDQVNNPGGSVFYLYSLVSLLVSESAATPRHKMSLNEDLVNSAYTTLNSLKSVKNDAEAKKTLGESLSGYPVSYQVVVNVRDYCNFILAQWSAGKKLSDPYFIWGVDRINPSAKTHYTKPIVVLVNELDFSGGDFFPAILQDNKRATIVGTRTAGAGGYVNSISFPNSFGFSIISFTGSIAERVDRNPIENLGVTPDIELTVTIDDIRKNFSVYTAKVNKIVDALIK